MERERRAVIKAAREAPPPIFCYDCGNEITGSRRRAEMQCHSCGKWNAVMGKHTSPLEVDF